MAKLITPEGETIEVFPQNGTDFDIEEMYKLIGCSTIEVCDGKDGKILIFDEEFLCRGDVECHPKFYLAIKEYDSRTGKTTLKPWLNKLATDAMHPRMLPYVNNVVCGNCLICDISEVN